MNAILGLLLLIALTVMEDYNRRKGIKWPWLAACGEIFAWLFGWTLTTKLWALISR